MTAGVVDMDVQRATGGAYISSARFKLELEGQPAPKGENERLWVFLDYTTGGAANVRATLIFNY